jgi:hypothetical protein
MGMESEARPLFSGKKRIEPRKDQERRLKKLCAPRGDPKKIKTNKTIAVGRGRKTLFILYNIALFVDFVRTCG